MEGKHYTPSNITEEDKKEIFIKMPYFIKYCVIFDEMQKDCGSFWDELYGYPVEKKYNNGMITYQQMNFYKTLEEAQKDCEIFPKIENKNYKNPFIVKR